MHLKALSTTILIIFSLVAHGTHTPVAVAERDLGWNEVTKPLDGGWDKRCEDGIGDWRDEVDIAQPGVATGYALSKEFHADPG